MSGRIKGKLHRSPCKHRTILRVVLWTLLISLLMPGIALDTLATHAQDGEEAEQPPSLECGEGTIPNDEGTDCVPDPDLQPPPLECPEGEVPDETGSGCIPDPNLQPPPLDCGEGTIPNDDGTACVSDPNAQSELECDEGMVPDETGSECVLDSPTETPVEDTGEDDNAIDFSTYLCPAGTPREADKEHYERNCQPASRWEFELQHPDGSSGQTTGPDGRTTWSGVPVGDWTATEFLPEDHGDPIVYCRYTEWPEEADEMGDWSRSEAIGGSYSDAFAYEGMHRECHWYNFTDADEAEGAYELAFTTFTCDPGIPMTDDKNAYDSHGCQPGEGWAYQIQHGGPGGSDDIVTSADGTASVPDLPTGTSWSADAEPKSGYGSPRAWCRVAEWSDGAEPEEWQGYESGQLRNVPANATRVECHWYYVSGTESHYVAFYKRNCPPGTSLERDKAYYEPICQPVAGWEFALEWAERQETQATDVNGYAGWSGLPTDTWRASEDLPPGWGDPYVECYSPVTGTWVYIQAAFEQEFFVDGEWMECYWYNFPPEGDGVGEVEIAKFACPADFQPPTQPALADQPAFEAACEDYLPGVTFELLDGNGATIASGQTGDT